MALLSVGKSSIEAFLVLLLFGGCLFIPSDPGKCYTWHMFPRGRLHGTVMRRTEDIGPFTCIRECLVRKRCKSINFEQTLKVCEINYEATYMGNPLIKGGLFWWYLEKNEMRQLLDVSPCNDTVCGDNGRCEVLANNSVFCSITECSPLVGKEFQLINQSKSVMMTGSLIQYKCTNNAAVHIERRCQQTGIWKELGNSPNECGDQSDLQDLPDW